MQTPLIIRALEIIPPETDNCLIIPPQEEHNDNIKRPRASHLTPHGHGADIQRRHGSKSRKALVNCTLTLGEIDGNHYRTADDAHEDEDVATHFGEAQKDGSIEADGLDQLGFFGAQDRLEPSEEASSHGGRRVFVVRMLGLRGVDDGMTGTKEGEEQGEEDGGGDGGDQGSRQGVQLELSIGMS